MRCVVQDDGPFQPMCDEGFTTGQYLCTRPVCHSLMATSLEFVNRLQGSSCQLRIKNVDMSFDCIGDFDGHLIATTVKRRVVQSRCTD
jgi:hypothetical protein